jgi:hypothetical protein
VAVTTHWVCGDCQSYTPVDCFKGYCHENGGNEVVFLDAGACDSFQAAGKCKYCAHYQEVKPFMGHCDFVGDYVFSEKLAWTCSGFRQA